MSKTQRKPPNFYSRPCGRGDPATGGLPAHGPISTHAPAGGATVCGRSGRDPEAISTHAPAGGATIGSIQTALEHTFISTHAPAGGATGRSRPACLMGSRISTHAPAGGATGRDRSTRRQTRFLLTPLREGRPKCWVEHRKSLNNFYSRPCGRGDMSAGDLDAIQKLFLLTPLREGRLCLPRFPTAYCYFYSRPCGRGDGTGKEALTSEGNFYSRPCGRGDLPPLKRLTRSMLNFYSRPCGRGDGDWTLSKAIWKISTHAPAGGATDVYSTAYPVHNEFLLTPLREGRRQSTA